MRGLSRQGRFASIFGSLFLVMGISCSAALADGKSTLDAVKERGTLRCSAHNGSFPGFFELDSQSKWKGFDIQFCKAVGAAIFGSADKVTYVPVSWAQRFPSLASGDIDVLFKSTGWTFSRDTGQNIDFSIPYFVGGFQLMVPTESKIREPKDLDGATICTGSGTSIEPILADYMVANGVKFQVVTYEKSEEVQSAYFSGRCDVYASFGPNLGVMRATKVKDPTSQTILPISLTLEPESAAVRANDKKWLLVINWVIASMVRAEELRITSANVDDVLAKVRADPASNPPAARLLGAQGDYGKALGLPATWAYDVIKQVGNYGEVYERELGDGSSYRIPRGSNRLWSNGGLIFAPNFD